MDRGTRAGADPPVRSGQPDEVRPWLPPFLGLYQSLLHPPQALPCWPRQEMIQT